MTLVLVTGAAGFVGGHLATALRSRLPHATLVGVDRDPCMPGYDRSLVCDLADMGTLHGVAALEPIDYVVHLAAQSYVPFSFRRPDLYMRDNVVATSNLIQVLAEHHSLRRFVSVSSCEVYGNTTATPATEISPVHPRSPYAASKLSQEFVALAAIDHQNLPAIVCRLFNNFGDGQQRNRLLPRVRSAAVSGREFTMVGDGSQVRDWVHVGDTCEALTSVMLGDHIAAGEVFNVCGQSPHSVAEVLALWEAATGRSLVVKHTDRPSGHLDASTGDARKLMSVTGWRPRTTLQAYIDSLVDA